MNKTEEQRWRLSQIHHQLLIRNDMMHDALKERNIEDFNIFAEDSIAYIKWAIDTIAEVVK